ncbi:MAG TPA: N-acetylmuramoyl-L-alanine amidase [Candidatus Acidoferrum sp.]|nr:N-acetylmuramoyl-L-alanine amidase [Candidatus Acidoferrum sp.]
MSIALARSAFVCVALALAILFCAGGLRADTATPREKAKEQFDKAQKDRAALEVMPEQQRTLDQYLQLVKSYHRVSAFTPGAPEVPFSLLIVGDLYREMGNRFDPKYFRYAVDTYQFLLHEYPESRYRDDALFDVAQIEKDDLGDPALAQKSFEEFLKLHPHSPRAKDAQAALSEIANPKQTAKKNTPPATRTDPQALPNSTPAPGLVASQSAANQPKSGTNSNAAENPDGDTASKAPLTQVSPTEQMEEPSAGKIAEIREIKSWTTPDYTRIVVSLDAPVKYQAARISNPERIYFDVKNARLGRSATSAPVQVEGDLLKAVRVAQNQAGVVRIVLEVSKIKDYSVFLLRDPYRMVVDVYAKKDAPTTQAAQSKAPPSTNSATKQHAPAAPNNSPGTPVVTKSSSKTGSDTSPGRGSVAPSNPSGPQINTRTIRASSTKQPPAPVPDPTRDGQQSLTRALGLKIGRIVIDAGHGGHDTGTIGPNGLMEKDLCLDVALRLGKMIEDRLPGTEVIYTREDDTFIPLEQRTVIANDSKADLFVSIHANSSPDPNARGVETYYLNFSPSPEAMQVAARENATAQGNVHDLEDLIQRIAKNEKVEESRELAADIQASLTNRLQKTNHSIRDRGVRKAPFVVLIGANMPSVLAEISFISNPSDESSLRKPDGRDRVADGLYTGIESYLKSTNSLALHEQPKPPASGRGGVASSGNQQ